jgi:hypothetical protein
MQWQAKWTSRLRVPRRQHSPLISLWCLLTRTQNAFCSSNHALPARGQTSPLLQICSARVRDRERKRTALAKTAGRLLCVREKGPQRHKGRRLPNCRLWDKHAAATNPHGKKPLRHSASEQARAALIDFPGWHVVFRCNSPPNKAWFIGAVANSHRASTQIDSRPAIRPDYEWFILPTLYSQFATTRLSILFGLNTPNIAENQLKLRLMQRVMFLPHDQIFECVNLTICIPDASIPGSMHNGYVILRKCYSLRINLPIQPCKAEDSFSRFHLVIQLTATL